jgi:hypothetical protein
MTDIENRILNKLIASSGWLTRAHNKWQIYHRHDKYGNGDVAKMVDAIKEANRAIDEAIEILRES